MMVRDPARSRGSTRRARRLALLSSLPGTLWEKAIRGVTCIPPQEESLWAARLNWSAMVTV